MKNSRNENVFHTNLLQALQKNKVIQGKLTECQREYYVQLLKNMQTYHLEEKYNRELLYMWKKESQVRQLKKNLQEYDEQRFGQRDAYYEYQLQKIEGIVAGQQRLVIPVSEEERRSNVHAKYLRFLRKNPVETSAAARRKSAVVLADGSNGEEDDDEEEEDEYEINARSIEDTWKHIHAQSAVVSRRPQATTLPSIHRSATIGAIRTNRSFAKSGISSKRKTSNTGGFLSANVHSTSNETFGESTNNLGVPEGIEPLNLTSDTLDKHTRADLVTMRSVRRTKKDPAELNLVFETRKRVCEINRRATNFRFCEKKYHIPQKKLQLDPPKPTEATNPMGNPPKPTEEKPPSDPPATAEPHQ